MWPLFKILERVIFINIKKFLLSGFLSLFIVSSLTLPVFASVSSKTQNGKLVTTYEKEDYNLNLAQAVFNDCDFGYHEYPASTNPYSYMGVTADELYISNININSDGEMYNFNVGTSNGHKKMSKAYPTISTMTITDYFVGSYSMTVYVNGNHITHYAYKINWDKVTNLDVLANTSFTYVDEKNREVTCIIDENGDYSILNGDNSFPCDMCGTIKPLNALHTYMGHKYCENCWQHMNESQLIVGDGVAICDICGKTGRVDEEVFTIKFGLTYCEDCFNTQFNLHTCARCGTKTSYLYTFPDDLNHTPYCYQCYCEIAEAENKANNTPISNTGIPFIDDTINNSQYNFSSAFDSFGQMAFQGEQFFGLVNQMFSFVPAWIWGIITCAIAIRFVCLILDLCADIF